MRPRIRTLWTPDIEKLEPRALLSSSGLPVHTTTYTTTTSTSSSAASGPGQNILYGQAYVQSLPSPGSTTAIVDYGDGTGVQTLNRQAGGTFILDHHYTKVGDYHVTVTQEIVTTQITTTDSNIVVGNVILGTNTNINTNTNTDTHTTAMPVAEAPAPLTIQANSLSIARGEPLPTLSATYYGFVNGDTPASLTSLPLLTCHAGKDAPIGTYTITASGASSPNYTITYEPGTLRITPATSQVHVARYSWTTNSVVLVFSGPIDPSHEKFALNGLHCGRPLGIAAKSYAAATETMTLTLRETTPLDTSHHSYLLRVGGQVRDRLVLERPRV